VGDVDLYLAAFGQRLDRVVDDGAFIQTGLAKFGDGHREHAVVLAVGIHMRFDGTAVGQSVGRGLDPRIGRKAIVKAYAG
jgi:hypothetical protein